MSYILDALRKSEAERQQGRVPDFGQQVHLIHRPKRKGIPAMAWVAAALLINAGVLAYAFWPGRDAGSASVAPVASPDPVETPVGDAIGAPSPREPSMTSQPAVSQPAPAANLPGQQVVDGATSTESQSTVIAGDNASAVSGRSRTPEAVQPDPSNPGELALSEELPGAERPTVIVPSANRFAPPADARYQSPSQNSGERVPHLVELSLSFQRSVPDLIFNSHVYASDPYARRVMINDHYLRVGESFEGIRVEAITEDGVQLSKNGTHFRVGVVRDWKSPR